MIRGLGFLEKEILRSSLPWPLISHLLKSHKVLTFVASWDNEQRCSLYGKIAAFICFQFSSHICFPRCHNEKKRVQMFWFHFLWGIHGFCEPPLFPHSTPVFLFQSDQSFILVVLWKETISHLWSLTLVFSPSFLLSGFECFLKA